jgi:anaerobic magnesium-protoporphyrin IX monomethyl ester cyclase
MTSRGCPFNCTYCGNEQKRKVYAGCGKFVRQISVDKAIIDLKKLKELGAKRILFVDDVLTMNRKWFMEFIQRYQKEIKLPFICFVHAKLFDDELAALLKKGGCQLIWYGIQSGAEKVREKVLGRFESNVEIIKAAEICKKFNLKFMIDHIFDIPFDKDVLESIKLYNTIRPNMINCYNLLYFPSAKIIDYAIGANILQEADIKKIDRGQSIVYQTGALSANSSEVRDNYSHYALLLTAIPILPRKMVEKICRSDKKINFFSKLPLFLIPFIKLFLNFRIGYGFVPLGVINTELFWIRKFIAIKLTDFYRPQNKKNLNISKI